MPTLYDMLLRHALYFEGAKRGSALEFRKIIRDLDAEVLRAFQRTNVDTFGAMTKTDFNRFMLRLRKRLMGVFESQGRKFDTVSRQLANIETTLFQGMFRKNTGERVAVNKRRVLSVAKNRDIAATGGTIKKAATTLRNATINSIEQVIRRGYVDKTSLLEIQTEIRGLRSLGYRNGVLAKIQGWVDSFHDTAFHHIGSAVKDDVASRYYAEYDWVSILDEHTTDICIDRAGQRYRYGEGPIPPAHYRCRSEAVPVDPEADTSPQRFADWLEQQPGEFLSDVFKAGRTDLDSVKVITLDAFKGKLEFVLV